ncbi:hypothetical protein LSH36_510g00015 [Paralvinella palmiformis]|uniref:THAP-type domain-containing protein n=1 Tax=Paralvinella palmiformis TaxID=53620 RepID=A0AAD9MYC0_9ANNE|nr:hypothetical protein LSH36_510g00015 [Paralvinella palmiformis]
MIKKWVHAIRRVDNESGTPSGKRWWPSNSSVVCKAHFIDKDYRPRSCVLNLQANAIPTVFNWTDGESATTRQRMKRVQERHNRHLHHEQHVLQSESLLMIHDELNVASVEAVLAAEDVTHSLSVQTENPCMVDICTQTKLPPTQIQHCTTDDLKNDVPGMQFYTGLDNYQAFMDVFAYLGPAVDHLQYMHGIPNIVPKDQLFLTIVKLRTYKTNYEPSRMFKIRELEVLVGVTPGGQVSYVSPAYGGSTSNHQIVERSDLIRICNPTDSIMADKGFDVQDIFAALDVTINFLQETKTQNEWTNCSKRQGNF